MTSGTYTPRITQGTTEMFENEALRIISGTGLGHPILGGIVYQPRTWNGTIHYTARPRPDARIQLGTSGPLVGNNTYNTTGLGQTRTGSAARGRSVIYYVSAQNDAPFAEQLKLVGGGSTSRFTVRYRNPANVNITPQVLAGTFITPLLAPQATYQIKVVVTVNASAPVGASLTRTLSVRSTTNPDVRDNARFVTRRS